MEINANYPLALSEGTVLAGQYVITGVLGQGGFGITYQAQDHKRNIKVAIKEFFPDSMATRSQGQTTVMPFTGDRGDNFEYGKQCFLQEAETLAQFIGNENIVRIYSYFEEYGTAYFVMDYIEGKSLDDYIKEKGGKLSFEEASELLIPVMDALGAVHEKGIVHRDVAPDNIYLTKDGKVKLLDFGAARQSLGDKSQSLDVVLKHGFAPKEQYTRRGRQGPYTDVYALGATFYFALTGKRPPDSLERLDEDDIVLPSTLGVKIPKNAEEALMTALNVRSEDRYQSMGVFKGELTRVRVNDSSAEISKLPLDKSPNTVQQRFFNTPNENEIKSKEVTIQNSIATPHESILQNAPKRDSLEKGKKGIKVGLFVVAGILAIIGLLVVIVAISSVAGSSNKAETTGSNVSDRIEPEETIETDTEAANSDETNNTTETIEPEIVETQDNTTDSIPETETSDVESKVNDSFYYKVPWGTSAEEALALLGDGYKLETYEEVKYVSGGHMESDLQLDYFRVAGGQVEERHACDVLADNQTFWEGLCYVNITVWSFTQEDVNTIIENHNYLFGSPVVSDTDSYFGHMEWQAGNIVVVMDNFKIEDGFDTGSLMTVNWYQKTYYEKVVKQVAE